MIIKDALGHEAALRNNLAMEKIKNASIHVCGAGALGSNLVLILTSMGYGDITVYDYDRVDLKNISGQVYSRSDAGKLKVDALFATIFQKNGCKIKPVKQKLDKKTIDKLPKSGIIVDVFDNTDSRQLLFDYGKNNQVEIIHAGVSGALGEIKWNEVYKVPQSNSALDTCEYPLATTLVFTVSAILAESITQFITNGVKNNLLVSLSLGSVYVNSVMSNSSV